MKKDTFELDLEECSEFHSVEMGYVCVGDMTQGKGERKGYMWKKSLSQAW